MNYPLPNKILTKSHYIRSNALQNNLTCGYTFIDKLVHESIACKIIKSKQIRPSRAYKFQGNRPVTQNDLSTPKILALDFTKISQQNKE